MVEKGRWIDLLSRKYRRRTVIVALLFCFYQTTGGGFVNVYGPTFYRQMGLGSKVFVYATLGQGIGIVSTIIAILLIDKLGRRLPIITGASILVVCNILIGTLGPKPNITQVEQNVVVASLILLLSGVKISFQCNACESQSKMRYLLVRRTTADYLQS
jgi:SP family sugar:H+ symporter-like MFS transporter